MRFRSYVDGAEKFMGPETSMEVQAALGSDIALVFDECLPFHVTRDYTGRSTERTHRWLDRCLDWHAEHGPEWQGVYGIVQGGVEEDLRRWSAREVAARDTFGLAIGGTLGKDKAQMYEVVGWTTEEFPEERPRHLLGIGDVDDLLRGVELGIDTFDCAMPTRIGRHGMAIVPDPERRWRVDLAKGRYREADEPLCEGCPCAACAAGYSRAYLHYLFRLRETTGARIVTLHNLAYLQLLMAALRDADRRGAPGRGRRRRPLRRRAVGDGSGLLELAQVALELAEVALLVAQDVDDHVLRRPVDAVAGLDDAVVVLDRARLGLDHAADHRDDVRGVLGRLQRRLLGRERERARGRAVQLLDPAANLRAWPSSSPTSASSASATSSARIPSSAAAFAT